MNESIIYLKKDYYGATSVVSIDKNKLSAIDVFRTESINISNFEDTEECDNYLAILESDGFKPSDRETFNKAFIDFTNNLNNLSKEL